MIRVLKGINRQRQWNFQIRVGLAIGQVMAGILGSKKICFDILGEAVDEAQLMEHTGVPNEVHVTEKLAKLLEPKYILKKRSTLIEVWCLLISANILRMKTE
jgi:class 3 adenylate cyclase